MRAIVIHAAKDLRIEEREEAEVGAGEVAVRIESGGICGSDLHYYNHGGFGAVRLREPMVLGHEIAGTVAEVGRGVSGLAMGDRVAVNPSRPCGRCRFCLRGLPNHCLHMRFYGSAMPMPHVQGGFRERLVCDAVQCVSAARAGTPELALAEPFAVALHAVSRAGALPGRRVLVAGCGPIGARVVAAARLAGAAAVVAADKGRFGVLFECSGDARALRAGLDLVEPRGTVVQVGLGGDVPLPQNVLVAKELSLVGSFRFGDEFAQAVALIDRGRVDVAPMLTGRYGIAEAVAAFERASDRRRAMKVQIGF